MDTKRFVVGTIVGAVVLFIFGYVIFDWAFAAFYAANAGSATGVDRGEVLYWALVLANLAYAALIMYAIGNRTGTLSILRRREDRSDRGLSSLVHRGLHALRLHEPLEPDEDDR